MNLHLKRQSFRHYTDPYEYLCLPNPFAFVMLFSLIAKYILENFGPLPETSNDIDQDPNRNYKPNIIFLILLECLTRFSCLNISTICEIGSNLFLV